MGNIAALFAEHLRTLLSVHLDDDKDRQFVDPVMSFEEGPGEQEFTVQTASGQMLLVTVVELPGTGRGR